MEETGKTLKNPEKPTRRLYDFGPFRADPQKRVLLKDGQPVALTGKPFDILLALLESHGELLTKDQLSGRLWPDTVVEEGNLWRNVSSLRKALGESPDGRPYSLPRPGRATGLSAMCASAGRMWTHQGRGFRSFPTPRLLESRAAGGA